jgi:tRNA(Ile)-lysidine synthase
MVGEGLASVGDQDPIPSLLRRCSFPDGAGRGARLPCALSGGPDSTALTVLAVAAGFAVTAWHVNHGIRSDADVDEQIARTVAERLGVAFEVRRIEVAPGPDLEARARQARYEALPADVCTGHTADDRAETVLLNIGRGGGLAGAATRFGLVRRPLLAIRRAETVSLCRHMGLVVADDSMNNDPQHTRVAIRLHVMPALADALGRDPVPLLNRHADLAGDALDLIGELAAGVDPTDTRALAAAPRALATEVLRRWLSEQAGSSTPPDSASVQRVLDVVAGVCVATEIEGGHRVARSANRLRFERARPTPETTRDSR